MPNPNAAENAAPAIATLQAEWLTREAFAPYGDVIETRPDGDPGAYSINGGMTQRHHDLAQVDIGEGRALINLFDSRPVEFPLTVQQLERHPLGSQAFVPLSKRPFVVVVAPPGETISNDTLRVFITNGQQGVNYHRGVWHHPLLALEADSRFVVVDRGGEGANCDELSLPSPVRLELPPGATQASSVLRG